MPTLFVACLTSNAEAPPSPPSPEARLGSTGPPCPNALWWARLRCGRPGAHKGAPRLRRMMQNARQPALAGCPTVPSTHPAIKYATTWCGMHGHETPPLPPPPQENFANDIVAEGPSIDLETELKLVVERSHSRLKGFVRHGRFGFPLLCAPLTLPMTKRLGPRPRLRPPRMGWSTAWGRHSLSAPWGRSGPSWSASWGLFGPFRGPHFWGCSGPSWSASWGAGCSGPS